MSKFFSFKLYRQGLKKSRLQGITIAGIVTALTSLIPAVMLLSPNDYEPGYIPPTTMIGYDGFAVPLFLLLLFTPILTLSMFSFLNKRNESDFYHSIPFTRPCVYFSFLAAVMTWIVITLITSVSAAFLLWSMVPYTAVPASLPFVHFIVYFLATLLLTAFTVVAMTLTGTTISNLLIFALLFLFVRVAGALIIACMESLYPMVVIQLSFARFLMPDYNIPLGILSPFMFGGDFTVFGNYGLWIYTAIVSILLIIAGCWLYTRRRSEMAGQSAPNAILQHVYRIMVSLPFVFLMVYLILEEPEIELMLVLAVITLLVYYVYEIITTKRLKNLLKATLFLPILVAGGILFGVIITISGNAAIAYTPDAEEIKSISIYNSDYNNRQTYEQMNTTAVAVNHPKVLEFVAKELKEMKKVITESDADHYFHPDRYIDHKEDVYYSDSTSYYPGDKVDYIRWTIKITDKSGKVCGRTLCLTSDEYTMVSKLFSESKEYEDALLKLPSKSEITYIDVEAIYTEDHSKIDQIWESFQKEFNALSREEKIEYKTTVMSGMWAQYSLNVHGLNGANDFYSSYPLDADLFPKTVGLYIQIANDFEKEKYALTHDELMNGKPDYTSLSIEVDGYYHGYDNQTELTRKAIQHLDSCKNAESENSRIVRVTIWAEGNGDEDSYYSFAGTRYYLLTEDEISKLYSILGVDGYVEKGVTE